MDRRNFLKISGLAGGGVLLNFSLPLAGQANTKVTFSPNLLVSIDLKGWVHFSYPRHEMGQGSGTGLPMIFADELGADWNKFKVTQANFNPALGNLLQGNTGGSGTIRRMWQPIREAAATTRQVLVEVAAKKWKVNEQECTTENSFVVHRKSGKKLPFAQLVSEANRLKVPDVQSVTLKDSKDFKLIGTPQKNVYAQQQVTGTAPYAYNTKIPGMVYASIARSPVYKGKVAGFDGKKALSRQGVQSVIPIKTEDWHPLSDYHMFEGVAVVATSTWAAFKGKKALKVQWNEGKNGQENMQSIAQLIEANKGKPGKQEFDAGNTAQALKNAQKTIKQGYTNPYQSHSLMEPQSAIAQVTTKGCEVWVSVQHPREIAQQIARLLKIPFESVKLNQTICGGSFGRRYYPDVVLEAVILAKKLNKTVKVVCTREDEIQNDLYHAYQHDVHEAAFNDKNELIGWHTRQLVVDDGDSRPYGFNKYSVPNRRSESNYLPGRLPVGAWRSVWVHQAALGQESFVDEIAHELKKDPLQFRLELLQKKTSAVGNDPRSKRMLEAFSWVQPKSIGVLKLVAEKADWGKKLPKGHGQGIAVFNFFGSTFCAQVAEVSVSNGELKIHKITAAVDCGTVINPQLARGQIEGGIIWALSALKHSNITIEKGRVQQSNYHDNKVLRINEVPEIEVHFVPSNEPPKGTGENSVPPLAPAVLNAIFAATGKRIRKLPVEL